jgi:lysozyme
MTRHINEAGLELIKSFEGLRLDAYQDQAGVWTIGYGHTAGVAPGQLVNQELADMFLRSDLGRAETYVAVVTRDVPTADDQFAAMVSLCFNIGSGNFRTSTVLRRHRTGDYQLAGAAFLLWNKLHADGRLVPSKGLTRRRAAERALYLSE